MPNTISLDFGAAHYRDLIAYDKAGVASPCKLDMASKCSPNLW